MRNFQTTFRRFAAERRAVIGLAGVLFLLLPAIYAPFIANGRPLVEVAGGELSFPFLRSFFAPDSTEYLIEQLFNWCGLALISATTVELALRRRGARLRRSVAAGALLLAALPFFFASPRVDKLDYRTRSDLENRSSWFAPIPYGPSEICGVPYGAPDRSHYLGCDAVGRDVAARLIYGARASLAVGILSTAAALAIGCLLGLAAGFFRGWFDLVLMRLVEMLLCFPTFLLLLILMSMLGDRKFEQSILLVIGVLALTSWIGLAFLVRGETLRQRDFAYVQSCIVSGVPPLRIMVRHLLPNIAAPVLISFSFGVAGAVLAESGLSFLGFGVRPPTASWGALLREAFDNPLDYWHLTFFPGLALFIAVFSFNLTGEGLRKAFSVREN